MLQASRNLLDRPTPSLSFSKRTPLQTTVDHCVGRFVEGATDIKSVAALSAGSLAYRAGRIGVLGLGSGSVVRAASVGLGLTAEVSTFELTHRGLSSVIGGAQGRTPLHANLWRWNGPGGLAQGLLQSFFTFGSLKGAGRIAQGENIVAQHLLQDGSLVFSHQMAGSLGIGSKPQGNLAEQFIHAETTLWQIGAGMTLAHGFAPGLVALERGLDVLMDATHLGTRSPRLGEEPLQIGPRLAFALGAKWNPSPQETKEIFNRPQILQMSRLAEENLGNEKEYFETLSEKAETDPEALEFLQILARAQYSFAFLALAAAAESNPRGVFVLRDLALEGDSLAAMLLQNLNIAKLVHLAKTNPEAVWALRYLEEAENEQAAKAMGEMELSSKPFTIPLEPMIFYPAQRPYSPIGRLEEIHRESEADPETVAFLKKLSDMGEDLATETMMTLGTRRLQETAERDLEAAYALYQLGQYGNTSALEFLRIMDVRHLLEDGGHKALTILSFAAQMGNEDAAALWFLAQKKRRGDPSD